MSDLQGENVRLSNQLTTIVQLNNCMLVWILLDVVIHYRAQFIVKSIKRKLCMTFDMDDFGQCEHFSGINIKRDFNKQTMSMNQTT